MGETIGIFELIKLIKNRWYLVLLTSAIGFMIAFVVSTYFIQPQYSASTSLLVSRSQTEEEPLQLGEIQTNIQMISTYRDVIENPVVLEKVMEKLPEGLPAGELFDKIKVQTQSDSQIFSIHVTDSEPERAAMIANAVAEVFRESIGEIINVKDMVILAPAVANPQSISPDIFFNEVVGTIAGAILGIAATLILAMVDTRVHDESFISDVLEWNRLGTITSMRKKDRLPLPNSEMETKEKQEIHPIKHMKGNANV